MAIDLHIGEFKNRSEFPETATRKFIVRLARKECIVLVIVSRQVLIDLSVGVYGINTKSRI
jgi:hypothetical protein